MDFEWLHGIEIWMIRCHVESGWISSWFSSVDDEIVLHEVLTV